MTTRTCGAEYFTKPGNPPTEPNQPPNSKAISRPSTHHNNCGQVLRILKTCIKALSMQWHNGPRGWVLFLFWVFQLKINVSELTFGFRGSIWFGLVGFVWLILFRRFNLVSLVCSVSQIIGGSVTDKGGKRQSYQHKTKRLIIIIISYYHISDKKRKVKHFVCSGSTFVNIVYPAIMCTNMETM